MPNTQQYIPIENIQEGLIFLKDGSVSLVLESSAVNFGLLFETEQIAIINSFAGLLSSLSFPIQIIILSRRLDVSSYLNNLDEAIKQQSNPQLTQMTISYRRFIEGLIKEKDVLDKHFYICIATSSFELGLLPQRAQDRGKKALTVLSPRRDHVVRQMARIGLKAKQLNDAELVKLFYGIYNPPANSEPLEKTVQAPSVSVPRIYPAIPMTAPVSAAPKPTPPPIPPSILTPPSIANQRHPFVIEELSDDFRP